MTDRRPCRTLHEGDTTVDTLREQSGEGTLYDTEGTEIATTVAYRIVPGPKVDDDEQTWGGELFYRFEDEGAGGGLYVLALEDGTRVNIDIDPRSAEDGDPQQVTFKGVGAFGERII